MNLRLATHLSDDPHAAALALAQEIAGRSPSAVRAGKRLWNEALLGTREQGFLLEEKLQGTLMGKPNQIEAVRANMEKREPSFSDPD